jgi:tRNA threonylcarbamoyladenosine biosynthesis protein TsaE
MGLTILNNVEAAQAFGESLAAGLTGGEVFAFYGVLGAGKTQLVKGLARGLGYRGDVTSPTFALVHEYIGGRLPIYHLDLYRMADEKEAARIGVEDYLPGDGVTVIEWPERILALLPPNTRHWQIDVASLTERTVRQK